MTDKEIISQQSATIAGLRSKIADLEEKLQIVLETLASASVKKDSSNSGIPPSKDIARKTQSLRKKSNKPSGGQLGHKGSNLKMVAIPDEVEDLQPRFCKQCGRSFSQEALFYQKSRQALDIAPVQSCVKEYRQYAGTCSCGAHQEAEFPSGVNAPVQYGKNIEAMVGYLSVNQHIPYKRMTGLLSDLFGISLSEGTVDNMLHRLSAKASPLYEAIKEKLHQSQQNVGSDETSCSVNGKKQWAWVWQNEQYCYLTISHNRGYDTVGAHFPKGFPNATLTSDRWAAQLKTMAKQHQICLVHIIRELNYLEALEKHNFSIGLRALFQKAIHTKKQYQVLKYDSAITRQLEEKLNVLLKQTIPKDKYPQTATLQKSLIKLRGYIFPFLYYQDVRADNNASERSIRTIKVKMKISGMFKSGQHVYATLMSVTQTLKKQGQNIFEAFCNIASLNLQDQTY